MVQPNKENLIRIWGREYGLKLFNHLDNITEQAGELMFTRCHYKFHSGKRLVHVALTVTLECPVCDWHVTVCLNATCGGKARAVKSLLGHAMYHSSKPGAKRYGPQHHKFYLRFLAELRDEKYKNKTFLRVLPGGKNGGESKAVSRAHRAK